MSGQKANTVQPRQQSNTCNPPPYFYRPRKSFYAAARAVFKEESGSSEIFRDADGAAVAAVALGIDQLSVAVDTDDFTVVGAAPAGGFPCHKLHVFIEKVMENDHFFHRHRAVKISLSGRGGSFLQVSTEKL